MNPGAIVALAWLAAAIVIAAFLRWAGKRRGDGDALATTAPAPAHPRVPEPDPGAGEAAGPRHTAPPAPGHGHAKRDRLLTARFFTDGCVLVWDATGRLTHTFEAGAPDWDGWLQEMTDDQH